MGETKNPHLYDVGIFGPVTKPQNQLFVSLETPVNLKNSETPWVIIFINLQILEFQNFDNFRKDAHRNMMKIRV